MMAAPISVNGATLEPGDAGDGSLQRASSTAGRTQAQGRQYDVAPDGRFLINTVLDSAAAPITLIQNWNPEANKR